MQGGSAVAAVFRAHSRLSHLGTDGSGSEPTNTAVAPISASNSRRLRSRSITVSPPPCLASEKSACLFFSTRVNSQELYEKPACPLFFLTPPSRIRNSSLSHSLYFWLDMQYRCIYTQRHAAVPSRSHFSRLSRLRLLETTPGK